MMKRLLRLALSGACFLVGLSAGAGVLAHFFPLWEEVSAIRGKLRHVAQHPAEYDTLFLGSSRVNRHVDPAAFDAVTAAAGLPTHSFNAAADGMFPPEDGFVCEQLFKQKPQGLRRVFVEISIFLALAADGTETTRAVAWHDLPRTWFVLREVFPWREWERAKLRHKKKRGDDRLAVLVSAWPRLSAHLQCCLRNVTNLGHGNTLLQPLLLKERGSESREDEHVLGPAGNGFSGLTVAPDPGQLATFSKNLAAREASPVEERALDRVEEANLEGMVRRIRAAGAEPVLLIPPNPVPLKHLPSRALGVAVLDFTDFRRWPELYKVEHRQDYGHLNRAGAELYTRDLAEEWLKLRKLDAATAPR